MSNKKVGLVWVVVAAAIIVLVSAGVVALSNSNHVTYKLQRGEETVSIMETNCVNSVKNVFPDAVGGRFSVEPVLKSGEQKIGSFSQYDVDGFRDAEFLVTATNNGETMEFACTTVDDPTGENVEWFRIA